MITVVIIVFKRSLKCILPVYQNFEPFGQHSPFSIDLLPQSLINTMSPLFL